MVNVSIDVTDLGGEARPGDKVVFWRPRMGGSATHAGRVISTAPVTVFLTDGKATVSDVEPGEMTVLLQCRGVESQGPVTVGVPDGDHTVTLRALLESQFEYAPPIVSAVQQAADNAAASERAAIQAQVRSEAAADRADAKVDDAINNGANLIRAEVKQDADRAVSARQAATQAESNAAASEDAAAQSESNAATSETNAKQSETNAGDYAAVAATAATEAVDAMEVASDAASSIGDSVSQAAASADSASRSETNAAQYESSAATHAQNATEAAEKVGTAAELDAWAQAAQEAADRVGTAEQVGTWASEASASASRAAQSESNAAASEDAAATSESNAKASEIAMSDAVSRVDALEAMAGLSPESPVDGQTANLIEQPETLTRAALDGAYPSTAITAVRVPKSVTFEDIQDALDEAKTSGETVVAGGVIDTDQTLIVECNCDFSQLVINYSGIGTAVRVGTTEGVTWRLSARLPHVRHTGKTSLGWGQVAGTIGVELVNLNSCPDILVPRVSRFEVGLAEIGTNGRGHSYNTVTIGHLENNKRNQVMMSSGSGWCNENLHLGGRFSHESAEGESVPGVKHIDLESADNNQINNNVWIKPSLEGVGNEWALDCGGVYNRVIAGRWERAGGARVRWGTKASYNVIEGGYHADRILTTSSAGATRNEINSPNRHEFFGTSTSRGIGSFLNTSSSTSPAWEIMNPSQQDQWTWRAAATSIQGRRSTDVHPRLVLDSVRGQVLVGNGVSEPSVGFAPVGSSALRVYGNVNFENEICLKSPDGSRWKILIGDDGAISTQKL